MFSRTSNAALVAGAAMVAAMTVSSPASAIPWVNFIGDGVNTLSDDSGELFVDKVMTLPGQVDPGDIFLGAMVFNSIANLTFGTVNLGVGGVDEGTAVFGLEVLTVAPGSFTFRAVADLQAEFLAATAGAVDIGATAANTFAKIFNDPTPEAARNGNTFTNFASQASDGSAVFELTIADNGILAFLPLGNNINALDAFCDASPVPGVGVGGFLGSATVTSSTTSSVDPGTPVGISGNVFCPVPPEDYTVRDDATFTFVADIPEPTTLAMLGIGLLGLSVAGRRRRRVA